MEKSFFKHLLMLCLFGMISIGANAEDIPNNEIWYEASAKLTETTSTNSSGLHTNAFNTSIKSHTFSAGKGIITFNADMTSIGDYAFRNCSGLTSVTIPNSVTSIGRSAFASCSMLESVNTRWTCEDEIPSISSDCFPFSTCDLYVPVKTFEIYNNKDYWKNFRNIIPNIFLNNVIWYEASEKLKSVTSSVENGLHTNAFNAKVKSHTFSNGQGCITFDADLTEIGDYAFYGSSNLTGIELPSSVESIGYSAFENCKGLEYMIIPYSITSIDEDAFRNCSSMTYLEIGSSVRYIDKTAFSFCSSLTNVSVAYGNTVYDSRDNCNAIIKTSSNTLIRGCKNTKIPNSVTSIGDNAFNGCSLLTSITIPSSVKTVGKGVFEGCTGLKSVNITDLDKWAEIEFGDGYANPISSNSRNLYLNGQLVTKVNLKTANKIGTLAFSAYKSLVSVNIPNSVISIGKGAFSSCSNLTKIDIPESVTMIGDAAFSNCSGLTSVTIPNSVTSIGEDAFQYCSGLTSVIIGNSVNRIGDYTFCDCKGLTSVTIGNSVTSIGYDAFYGCSSLASVNIPISVTSIGYNAFRDCSGLRNIIADGINAPTTDYSFSSVKNCSLHVPLGSEGAYATNFGTYFKSGNSYGNTVVPYSTYSKNSAGEYSFEVWDASSDVELSEGADKVYVPVEATVNDLQYKRTFNNTDWQALYVPFELDVKNDLAGFNVYEVSTSSADAINVTLITEGKTSANTPYLIKAKATGEQTIPVSSKTVKVTVENTNSDLSDFEIVGTYEKLNYGDIDGDWYALKGGKFMKAGEGAFLNPYRFYLKRKSSSAKESIDINLNEVTGIEAVQSADKPANNGKHYNLQGIEVNENYNGMIIMNGKKYLKK